MATMTRGLRHSRLKGLVVGSAVLLSIAAAVGHFLIAPSHSGRPNTYVVINPINGRVIASGPKFVSGATVTLNPISGQIVKVSS